MAPIFNTLKALLPSWEQSPAHPTTASVSIPVDQPGLDHQLRSHRTCSSFDFCMITNPVLDPSSESLVVARSLSTQDSIVDVSHSQHLCKLKATSPPSVRLKASLIDQHNASTVNTLTTLLNGFGSRSQTGQAHTTLTAVQQFLSEQPASAQALLQPKLDQLHTLIKAKPSTSHRQLCAKLAGQCKPTVQHRLDKKATGFHHTLLFSSTTQQLYQLMKSFDQNTQADLVAVSFAELLKFNPSQATRVIKKADRQQCILGEGAQASVYLAQRLADHCLFAVKTVPEKNAQHEKGLLEFANNQQLQAKLTADEQQHFIFAKDCIATVNSKHQPQSYLILPLLDQPNDSVQARALLKSRHYLFGTTHPLTQLAKRWLAIGAVLEHHHVCLPDFKPSNTIAGRMIDFESVLFSGQGALRMHTPVFFPPKQLARWSSAELANIDEDQLQSTKLNHYDGHDFTGVTRFTIGASIVFLVTGNTPAQFDKNHPLHLPFNKALHSYKRGYTDLNVSTQDIALGHLYNRTEQHLLQIAKAMMQDQPQDRLAPDLARDVLLEFDNMHMKSSYNTSAILKGNKKP